MAAFYTVELNIGYTVVNQFKFVGLRHEHTHTYLRYITHCSDFAKANFVCSHTWAKMYHILYNEHTL